MSHKEMRGKWSIDGLAVAVLASSALVLALAPAAMPGTYSWLRQTTSESAGQGVAGGWIARLWFLLFGLTVSWLALNSACAWPRLSRVALGAFGILMIAAAAFSTRPWWPGAAFDPTEDLLHSIAATTMGIAFAFGLIIRAFRRGDDRVGLAWDGAGIAASILLPLAMALLPDWAGLLQRLMFAIAYAWFIVDVLRRPAAPLGAGRDDLHLADSLGPEVHLNAAVGILAAEGNDDAHALAERRFHRRISTPDNQ